jgi:hypothetical protein
MKSDRPLGLPVGSVRAIIMFIFILPISFLLVVGRLSEIPDWYYLLVGMIVAFYFESRRNGEKHDKK